MKTILSKAVFILAFSFIGIGCKEKHQENPDHMVIDGQDKSSVTKTGQNIGSSQDSTTVDGPSGSQSNY
jgi:hypothetical protein